MMRPVHGPLVVHTDGGLIEVIARGAGPAGAVGVELYDGAVSLDLDGADVDQLVAARFPVDGRISPDQQQFIEAFFGPAAAEILNAPASARPTRIGAAQRPLSSRDVAIVDPAVCALVVGADALTRQISGPEIEALIALEVLTSAAEAGIGLDPGYAQWCNELIDALPQTFPVPGMERAYRDALNRAVAAGVLLVPPKPAPRPGPSQKTLTTAKRSPAVAYSSAAYTRAEVPAAAPLEALRVLGLPVTLDGLSLITDGVTRTWVGEATLRVSVPAAPEGETLWARVRTTEGTILAASPLLPGSGSRREANLLIVPRSGLILDITSSVTARVLDGRVAALAHASDCGRRAARLERLGAADEAAAAWQECAAWHEVVGDTPRAKLALVRAEAPEPGPPILLDALLEGRGPGPGALPPRR